MKAVEINQGGNKRMLITNDAPGEGQKRRNKHRPRLQRDWESGESANLTRVWNYWTKEYDQVQHQNLFNRGICGCTNLLRCCRSVWSQDPREQAIPSGVRTSEEIS